MGLMGLFKKGKKGPSLEREIPPLPKLPKEETPELPPIEETGEELPELPPIEETELPSTPMHEKEISPPVEEGPALPEPEFVKEEPITTKIPMPHHYAVGETLFVDVKDYKELVEASELIKAKIQDAEDILRSLHNLKEKKEKILKKWQSDFADIQRKLSYIDKALFETST